MKKKSHEIMRSLPNELRTEEEKSFRDIFFPWNRCQLKNLCIGKWVSNSIVCVRASAFGNNNHGRIFIIVFNYKSIAAQFIRFWNGIKIQFNTNQQKSFVWKAEKIQQSVQSIAFHKVNAWTANNIILFVHTRTT